jgi:sec-independent protein translocase protein TatA
LTVKERVLTMPLGLHLPELIIVLAVALLIFGPKKLPEMGSAIGKSIKEFRKGMSELGGPKDEPVEETKVPVSTANEMNKLNTAAVETDATVSTSAVNKEVTSSEVKN